MIRRDYRADLVRSNRLRTPEERNILAERGGKIAVLEAQGPLFFGSAEQLLRRLDAARRRGELRRRRLQAACISPIPRRAS